MGSARQVIGLLAFAAVGVSARTIDGELLGLTRGDTGRWGGAVSMRVAGKTESFRIQYDFKRSNWSDARCWRVGARWRFGLEGNRIVSIHCRGIDWEISNEAVRVTKTARAMLLAIRTGDRSRAQALLPFGFVLRDSDWESWRRAVVRDTWAFIPPEYGDARCTSYRPSPEESIATPRAGCLDSGWSYSRSVGFIVSRQHGTICVIPELNWRW